MTKNQLLFLSETLKSLDVSGTKFNYGIAKNLSLMESEIKALNETKNKIIEKYAEKEKDGRFKLENLDPKTGRGNYVIKDLKGFGKEMEEFNKIAEEKSDFKPYKIKLVDVPEGLTTQQMASVYELIEE